VTKHSSSTCSLCVKHFTESNNMLWLDVLDGECDYTYHDDVNSHYSLLDYFIVSPSIANGCQSVSVLNDGDNPSDHLAISCSINVTTRTTEPTVTGRHSNALKNSKLNWNAANLDVYTNSVCVLLNHIDIPNFLLILYFVEVLATVFTVPA